MKPSGGGEVTRTCTHTHTYRQAHTHTHTQTRNRNTKVHTHSRARTCAHSSTRTHARIQTNTIIISPVLLRALHCKQRTLRAQSLAVLSIVHALSLFTRTCTLQTHTLSLSLSLTRCRTLRALSLLSVSFFPSLPLSHARRASLYTHTHTEYYTGNGCSDEALKKILCSHTHTVCYTDNRCHSGTEQYVCLLHTHTHTHTLHIIQATGAIAEQITKDFGSFDEFKKQYDFFLLSFPLFFRSFHEFKQQPDFCVVERIRTRICACTENVWMWTK